MTLRPIDRADEKMLPTTDPESFSGALRVPTDAPQTKTSKTLPKMEAGSIHAQFVRCGRPGCRCAAGRLHGPYFYRFWREAGRLRKAYVLRSQLDDVRTACDEQLEYVRDLRSSRQAANALIEHLSTGDAP